MSDSSSLALFALVAMVILYAVEDRSPFAPLGFAVAAAIAALSDFVLHRWSFGAVALGFAVVALRRWHLRRHRNGHA